MSNVTNKYKFIAALPFLLFCGCATRKDMESIKKNIDELKAQIATVEVNTAISTSSITYEIYDILRSKRVAYIVSDVHIRTGERIFLNDDIWDVKFVKIFTNTMPAATDGTPQFRSTTVQLLVTFGGKATDMPKK